MQKQFKAVTLLEILAVVVIIGILVALALPKFGTIKERAIDKEAKANLKLIQAAEKIYRMEVGSYYPAPVDSPKYTQDINTNLKLSLPAGSSRNWTYSASGGATLTAEGTRNIAVGSSWYRNYAIDQDDDKACCCPRDSRCPSQDWCAVCP